MSGSLDFSERYGPWAVVAGASEGLGAEFARALATRGVSLILLARRQALLDALAEELRGSGVQVHAHAVDLASEDFVGTLEPLLAQVGAGNVGLGIYNAAYAPVGELEQRTHAELMRMVDVNARGPLSLTHVLLPHLRARGRGGLVYMSSLAGNQGTPRLAGYAATKAFNTTLAESLWGELRTSGIDVLACCAGAIRTPGYASTSEKEAPGTLDATEVATRTLKALSNGPRVTPGLVNKLASFFMGRLLPRRAAIQIMASSTRDLQ